MIFTGDKSTCNYSSYQCIYDNIAIIWLRESKSLNNQCIKVTQLPQVASISWKVTHSPAPRALTMWSEFQQSPATSFKVSWHQGHLHPTRSSFSRAEAQDPSRACPSQNCPAYSTQFTQHNDIWGTLVDNFSSCLIIGAPVLSTPM